MSTKNMTQEEVDRRDARTARTGALRLILGRRKARAKARKRKRELGRREARWIAQQEAQIAARKAERARLRRISRLKPEVRAKKRAQKGRSEPPEAPVSPKPRTARKRR